MILQEMILDASHEFTVQMDYAAAAPAVEMQMMLAVVTLLQILLIFLFLCIKPVPLDQP